MFLKAILSQCYAIAVGEEQDSRHGGSLNAANLMATGKKA